METIRQCNQCKKIKNTSLFPPDYNNFKRRICKQCKNKNQIEYRKKNIIVLTKKAKAYYREKISIPEFKEKLQKQQKNIHLKRYYGITLEEYNLLLLKQNNKCAICRKKETHNQKHNNLSVDHNHKTKEVRGLLCHACNIALGHVNEEIRILKRMIEYIRKYNLFQEPEIEI